MESLLILFVAWVLVNVFHSLVTMKKGVVKDKFFCLSNWMKKDLGVN
jgi:hypothetical protein